MRVYIVRHAWTPEADEVIWPDDGQRPLTPEGQKRFDLLAKKLMKRGFAPAAIASSPLVRCRQTAHILLDRLDNAPSLTLLDALAPGASLVDVLPWLEHHEPTASVCLVGHAPDVSTLVSDMIGGGHVPFNKGAVACVEFESTAVAGAGELRWFVNAKLLNV